MMGYFDANGEYHPSYVVIAPDGTQSISWGTVLNAQQALVMTPQMTQNVAEANKVTFATAVATPALNAANITIAAGGPPTNPFLAPTVPLNSPIAYWKAGMTLLKQQTYLLGLVNLHDSLVSSGFLLAAVKVFDWGIRAPVAPNPPTFAINSALQQLAFLLPVNLMMPALTKLSQMQTVIQSV